MGPRSARTRVVLAQNTTRSLLFFILCNLTPPTKPSRREREEEREIFPRRLDFTQNIRTRKETWADSAADPPSSQWTLIIGEVPRRFPCFSRGFNQDLPRTIVIFQSLNSTFLSARSISKGRHSRRGTCPFTN